MSFAEIHVTTADKWGFKQPAAETTVRIVSEIL